MTNNLAAMLDDKNASLMVLHAIQRAGDDVSCKRATIIVVSVCTLRKSVYAHKNVLACWLNISRGLEGKYSAGKKEMRCLRDF